MFHLFANTLTTGGAVTLTDVPAVADANFSIRNSHYIFSEPYNMLAAAFLAATGTALQSNIPHWNYVNPHQIYPGNLSLTVPANVQVADYRAWPMPMPIGEEIAWQASDSGSEQFTMFTWAGTTGWKQQRPSGIMRTTALATCSYTSVANTWGADAVLTITSQLRSGTYIVLGAQCQRTNGLAFRLNFTRSPMYLQKRKLIPGDLCINTYSGVPNHLGPDWLGVWGAFNTVEFPLLEVFATASATATATLWLNLLYISDSLDALDGAINSLAA